MTITVNGKCKLVINPKCLPKAFRQAKRTGGNITEIETGEGK